MFGIFLGACYGGFCRLLNNMGRRFKLVERQSFLAHVIGMALGVVGVTTLVGEEGFCDCFQPSKSNDHSHHMDFVSNVLSLTCSLAHRFFSEMLTWRSIHATDGQDCTPVEIIRCFKDLPVVGYD
jgi:hypothetical protein